MSTERARALRQKSTWAERCLWRLLRSRRLAGYKFRRQRIEHPYYLDFYCTEARFAIELDGAGHGRPGTQKKDSVRDSILARHGILIKRIWNHQLLRAEDRRKLLDNLWQILQSRAPHPQNVAVQKRREPDVPAQTEQPSP